MKTRADIRNELDGLAQDIARAGFGVAPLIASARQVGEMGECRPPGLYHDGAGRVPVVVYDEFPDEATLRRYFPNGVPLLVGGEADVVALVGG